MNPQSLVLLSTAEPAPSIDGLAVETGSIVFVAVTNSSDVTRDLRENIRNLLGGRMRHYEGLIEATVEIGFSRFREKLAEHGWDGAFALRISHPSVVDGGCEVVVYGTPFRYLSRKPVTS